MSEDQFKQILEYLKLAGFLILVAAGILWLHKSSDEELHRQEVALYEEWGLDPMNVSGDRDLVHDIVHKGKYVDYVYLGHDKIEIMNYNGYTYGVYADGSGVLLPDK